MTHASEAVCDTPVRPVAPLKPVAPVDPINPTSPGRLKIGFYKLLLLLLNSNQAPLEMDKCDVSLLQASFKCKEFK